MLGALTFEQTRLVSIFCDGMVSLDDNIVYVSVVSRHGRPIESKSKGDSAFRMLTKHELDQVHIQRMLQTQMTKDFDDKLGKFEVTTIEREQYTEYIFPFYDGILFVVFSSRDNLHDVAKKISQSIKDFNFEIAKIGVSC